MSLAAGTRLGPYELGSLVGAGGMGEVYRAKDTRLNRTVAIKILPPQLATDPQFLDRFDREARIISQLDHPHICALYDLGDAPNPESQVPHPESIRFLVMQYLEGETLAERLVGGRLPIREALQIAPQIADALDAAHQRGIIHRDLKPANIKLTRDGTVKVLDFGLSKVVSDDAAGPDRTHAPTVTVGGSHGGMLLGTVAYMSPEQARGQPVDKRTDIWAFGCVLYEMLAGQQAFSGTTSSDALARVLEREPDWGALPSTTPVAVRRLLKRCFEKDLKRRLRDIGDARVELDVADTASPVNTEPIGPLRRRERIVWASALVLCVGLTAAVLLKYATAPSTSPETTRFGVAIPGHLTLPIFTAIAPDGRQLAFVATDSSGRSLLWVRQFDALEPRVFPGTEDAAHPFWSPDSRWIGFVSFGKVKKVATAGGPVQTLAEQDQRFRSYGTWSQDDRILFVQSGENLALVSAAGGAVTPVPVHDASGRPMGVNWPRFLPDGRHFLFVSGQVGRENRGLYVGSLDSPETKFLVRTDFKGAYAPPGYLLFMRDDASLMAQPFDTRRLELTGDASLVAEHIFGVKGAAHNGFSVSSTGALAMVDASITNAQLAWFDRQGRRLQELGPPALNVGTPQLSPDGKRVAIARGPASSNISNIWIQDATTGASTRLTFDPASDKTPLWSSDGSRIVFESNRADGRPRIYQRRSNGSGSDELLYELPAGFGTLNLLDRSPDGRYVVYLTSRSQRHLDLWVTPLGGDKKPFPFLETDFNKGQAQVSPDGRWLAYTSTETGKNEVYVQSFPTSGSKRQVSTDGGVQPRWRRDGKELFYLAPNLQLMAVAVRLGADLEVSRPVAMFHTDHLPTWGAGSPGWTTAYDVAPDGQRFLLMTRPEQDPAIAVILNWMAILRK